MIFAASGLTVSDGPNARTLIAGRIDVERRRLRAAVHHEDRARHFDAGEVVELRALPERQLGRLLDGALDDRDGVADRGEHRGAVRGELLGRERLCEGTLRNLAHLR